MTEFSALYIILRVSFLAMDWTNGKPFANKRCSVRSSSSGTIEAERVGSDYVSAMLKAPTGCHFMAPYANRTFDVKR